jgi:hypothetical protein
MHFFMLKLIFYSILFLFMFYIKLIKSIKYYIIFNDNIVKIDLFFNKCNNYFSKNNHLFIK